MDNAVSVPVKCTACGNELTLTLPADGYRRFQAGEAIQVALPDVSADDREMLISGTCAACWDAMFKDLDDEVADDEDEERGDDDDADGGDEG